MSGPADLLGLYHSDRNRSRGIVERDEYAVLFGASVRRTFEVIDALTTEVAKALAGVGYQTKLVSTVRDRVGDLRIDRSSEHFAEYLKGWGLARADNRLLGAHWEATVEIVDHRRAKAGIGLAVAIERPELADGGDIAFVEFWTTGAGVSLPSGRQAFQAALIASIVKFEDAGVLRSRQPRAS